jgi:hypothetical protein
MLIIKSLWICLDHFLRYVRLLNSFEVRWHWLFVNFGIITESNTMTSTSFLWLLTSFIEKLRHKSHSETLISYSSFLNRVGCTLVAIFIPCDSFGRAYICIVAIPLTFKAKYRLVLNVVLVILSEHFIEFILRNLVLLAISRFVASISAPMASHIYHWLLERKQILTCQCCLCIFISEIFMFRKVRKNHQGKIMIC